MLFILFYHIYLLKQKKGLYFYLVFYLFFQNAIISLDIYYNFFMIKQIDFYVEVIDNFWDIWFAINLANIMIKNDDLLEIRLFSNNKKLFDEMTKNTNCNIKYFSFEQLNNFKPSNIIFNFFDRKIDYDFLTSFNIKIKLLNFWYFLMHDWVSNLHLTTYDNNNVSVTYFVPSLLENTWWVLINNNFDYNNKQDFLTYLNKKYNLNIDINLENIVSIFVYKDTLDDILKNIKNDNNFYFIFWYSEFVINKQNVFIMPFFEINDYNNFLRICDLNVVRWENSLVSSLLAWKPTLWDIYKENNNAHVYKINDFINFLNYFSFDNNYFDIFKNFNESEKYKSLDVFLKNKSYYTNNFICISNYINNNCDSYKKIKEILN